MKDCSCGLHQGRTIARMQADRWFRSIREASGAPAIPLPPAHLPGPWEVSGPEVTLSVCSKILPRRETNTRIQPSRSRQECSCPIALFAPAQARRDRVPPDSLRRHRGARGSPHRHRRTAHRRCRWSVRVPPASGRSLLTRRGRRTVACGAIRRIRTGSAATSPCPSTTHTISNCVQLRGALAGPGVN